MGGVVVTTKLKIGKLAGGGIYSGVLGFCLGSSFLSGAYQRFQVSGDLIGYSIVYPCGDLPGT